MHRFIRLAEYRKAAYIFLLSFFVLSPLPADGHWDLVLSGEKSFLSGELDEAQTLFEKTLEQRPEDPRILSDLGRVYFHQGRLSDAEIKFTKALQSDAAQDWIRCWSYLYMGRIYSQRDETDKAFGYFMKAGDAGVSNNCNSEVTKYSAYTRIMEAQRGLSPELTTGCCILYFDDGLAGRDDILSLGSRVQEFYDKVIAEMDIVPDNRRIAIYLYPAEYEMYLWDAREVIAGSGLSDVNIYYNGMDDMGHLEHEMAHIMTAGMFDIDTVIPLLSEGVAEYLAGDPWGMSMNKWIKGFVVRHDFIPVHQLLEPRQFREINPVISYTEAGSFVKYLINNYGAGRFRKLALDETAWEEVYEKTAGELEDEWIKSISGEDVTEADLAIIQERLLMGDYYNSRSHKIWFPYSKPDVLMSWRARQWAKPRVSQ